MIVEVPKWLDCSLLFVAYLLVDIIMIAGAIMRHLVSIPRCELEWEPMASHLGALTVDFPDV